jgi:hypothetical protein
MAFQEMEDRTVDRKPDMAQQREVSNEDAIMQPVKGRKKRYRGR